MNEELNATSGDATPEEQVGDTIALGFDSVGERINRVIEDPTLDTAVSALGPVLVDVGLAIFGLIVLILVVSVVGRWTQKLTRLALSRVRLETTVVLFLSRVAKYAVWVLALPVALEIFGIQTASFAAVIGAMGLAIGLAMQGSLSNIAAGIMLLVLRPIRIGDWVEIDGEYGEITDVGIFYTHLNTFQNKLAILPNSEVLGVKIEHYTANTRRRLDLPVGVAYGTDLREAKRVLEEAAVSASISPYPGNGPKVVLKGFGDSSINFDVRVWCLSRDYWEAQTRGVMAINDALHGAGIEIPFPQRTLTFGGRLGIDREGKGVPEE